MNQFIDSVQFFFSFFFFNCHLERFYGTPGFLALVVRCLTDPWKTLHFQLRAFTNEAELSKTITWYYSICRVHEVLM